MYKSLLIPSESRIVFIVIDGLGGIPHPKYKNKTELEAAKTPHLDKLALEGSCGAHTPVKSGVTPGSVDGHAGIFGFDPLEINIGRGSVEAAGLGFDLEPHDIAIRCNWVTLDDTGKIIDRRAQRKETTYYTPLIKKLKKIQITGVEFFILQGAEHRFVLVIRKKGLGTAVTDSDPQKLFVEPLEPKGLDAAGTKTAEILQEFIAQAQGLLSDEKIANGFTLRGYSHKPIIPTFKEAYGFHAAGIATHPLYKGIARLFGMDVIDVDGKKPQDVLKGLVSVWQKYDFYYLHFKWADSRGEDGDFKAKVKAIEEIDKIIPGIMKLKPEAIVVTGDHSTPAYMAHHSWHPVPTLIWGQNAFRDNTRAFSEKECSPQALNTIVYAKDMIMPQVLAVSGRLKKYGP